MKYMVGKIFFMIVVLGGINIFCENKKRMKILMIVARFPKIHDICMLNQITGLIDRGHDVHIFSFARGDDDDVQPDVIEYGLMSKTIFENLPDSLDEYDIVMFQLGHKLFDVKKTHHFKGKVVVCLRGYDITGFLYENPHAYNKYFKSCDLFLPVCEAFKTILEREGCDPDKIIVHHSAIDCSLFKFKVKKLSKDGRITIVSAGRFVEKKGFVYAIRAIARLVKVYPNIRYILIGEGVLRAKYKKLIKQLNIGKNVKIETWYTHDKYVDVLNGADIFIAPSIVARDNDQEGIPNVLKEAMATGRFVVATNHSGNSELIEDGVSGFLVSERNSHAIYKVVDYIINNSDNLFDMQLAALSKILKEFEKERENDKLEAILYNLLVNRDQELLEVVNKRRE